MENSHSGNSKSRTQGISSDAIEISNWISHIPNMQIHMKWTCVVGCFEKGEQETWLIRIEGISEGSKSAWAEAETHGVEGGLVPLPSASSLVWGIEVGNSLTNCAPVPFMNIHCGVFRPRLISRQIEEETRTLHHKRSISPLSTFSGGCWQNSPSSLAKKRKGKKKLPEKHGTVWSWKWMSKQRVFFFFLSLFFFCHRIFSAYYACLSKRRTKRNTIIWLSELVDIILLAGVRRYQPSEF